MKLTYGQVKGGCEPLRSTLAAGRSARNRATRDQRAQQQEDREQTRHHRRRRAKEDRELQRALTRKFGVQVPERERPRTGNATPRKLFHRSAGALLSGAATKSLAASDGLRSIHFGFTARGLASTKGRRWRTGEGARAALYITRLEGLEGGELGWRSNIGADRNEVVAYHRALEAIETHDRANANVYISEIIALDATLTARQRRKVVRRICSYFEKRGLGYVAGIHEPDASGDQRNFHVHIIYSLRPVRRVASYDWEFAASKVSDINTPSGILARRKIVVGAINATLAAAGSGRRYTQLSNSARNLPEPEPKLGQTAVWLRRRISNGEAKLAALQRLRAAMERIARALAMAREIDALGLTASSRLAQQREKVTVERATLRARVNSAALKVFVRMDGARRRTVDELRIREERLSRIGQSISSRIALYQRIKAAVAEAGALLQSDPLQTIRANMQNVIVTRADNTAARVSRAGGDMTGLRETVGLRLADAAERHPDPTQQIKRSSGIANGIDGNQWIAARPANLPDLAASRAVLRDRLIDQRARIAGQLAGIVVLKPPTRGDRAPTEAPPKSAGMPEPQAAPATTVRKRSIGAKEAIIQLRALLPMRTPTTAERDMYGPARRPVATVDTPRRLLERDALLRAEVMRREPEVVLRLRMTAFSVLRAQDASFTLDGQDPKFVKGVLFDDELRAVLHPDHADETHRLLLDIHREQAERRARKRKKLGEGALPSSFVSPSQGPSTLEDPPLDPKTGKRRGRNE